jgi:hypothetical protein
MAKATKRKYSAIWPCLGRIAARQERSIAFFVEEVMHTRSV